MKRLEDMTDAAEVAEAYRRAVRNLDSDIIGGIEKDTQPQPDDSPVVAHAKAAYAKLVRLSHGVIDLRPSRPARAA